MKKALIIVDYNNDFVADDGKLTCGEPAQGIENNIVQIINEFSQNEDFIFIATDSHSKNDLYNPESKAYPEHCISGTERL